MLYVMESPNDWDLHAMSHGQHGFCAEFESIHFHHSRVPDGCRESWCKTCDASRNVSNVGLFLMGPIEQQVRIIEMAKRLIVDFHNAPGTGNWEDWEFTSKILT